MMPWPKLGPFRLRTALALIACAAAAAGCAVGPDFVPPAPPAQTGFTRAPGPTQLASADGVAQSFAPQTKLRADWWRLFGSDAIDQAVAQAFEHNPGLDTARATLRQSEQNLRAGEGVFYPGISAAGSAERARAAPVSEGSSLPGSVFNVVSLSATVSYPMDLFGGERRKVEALRAQVDDQEELLKAAYLSLSANVVNACIARAAYAAQLRATQELIELEKEQLATIEVQVKAGTSPYANLLSQRSLIASNQASLAQLNQKIDQAGHLLTALQGVAPDQVQLPDFELGDLTLPAELPLSLPSELVRQRPDILAAQAQLHAASAGIGVATAALYPALVIDANFGKAGTSGAALLADGARFWSIGPSVAAPLFEGGTLRAQRQAAIDAFQAQEAIYRQTVVAAFQQVADVLRALEHDAQALRAYDEAQQTAAEALRLQQVSYRAGLVAFIDVLAADVQFHNARIAFLQAVAQRQQDTVSLYAALGGGWWNASAPIEDGRPASAGVP